MTKGIRFEKNYINEIIFRVNFSNILKLSGDNKEAAEEFRKIIFKDFPNIKFKFNKNINLKLNLESGESESLMKEGNLTWIFTNNDRNKEIKLNANSLILHYKKGAYIGFKQFLDDILLMFDALTYYTPYKLNFMGLRYINQINEDGIDEKNIKKYINPSLINDVILDLEDGEEFSQCLSRIDSIKDNYNFTFQYGFFNPGFPDPTFKKDFILDYDCQLKNINLINSSENLINEIENMNFFIYRKFDYSITDDLKKLMGEYYESSND